LRPP
jgi:hypothetical protein